MGWFGGGGGFNKQEQTGIKQSVASDSKKSERERPKRECTKNNDRIQHADTDERVAPFWCSKAVLLALLSPFDLFGNAGFSRIFPL